MDSNKRVFSRKFLAGIAIYAGVFLAIVGICLVFFWNFIEAYELSRPKNTIKAYVDQLTAQQASDGSDDLYATIDQNLQSREQFDQVIQDSLQGTWNYAKKSSESTETRQVFVLRSGRTPVGEFSIAAGNEDSYGFRRWTVDNRSFDFSHLMGQPVSVTVPSDFRVTVNGNLLDERYITADNVEYEALDGFYGDYKLPYKVTYTAEGFLGEAQLEVSDSNGNPVEITEETDWNNFLPTCDSEQTAAIEAFAKEFVRLWVAFSGSTHDTSVFHYYNIKNVLSSDGILAERLYTALDGLSYGQSHGAVIQDIPINRIVPLEDGLYMCDVTYLVQAYGKNGPVDTTSNMKLILSTENGALKVKSMQRY